MTPSSVNRAVDPDGDAIATFTNDAEEQVQAAALVDASGDQTGISANPLAVTDAGVASLLAALAALFPSALIGGRLDVNVGAGTIPLPTGAATAVNQTTQNTAFAAIQTATALGAYGTNHVDPASATVTYVGKETALGVWLVQKIDTTSGASIAYATTLNNGSVLDYATAWAARATLTYGTYAQAF